MKRLVSVIVSLLLATGIPAQPAWSHDGGAAIPSATGATTAVQQIGQIAPYRPRFGRTRPVVAVIGENRGTELTDFVIPYSVLVRSGAAEVLSVATEPGVMQMRPALRIKPAASVAEFDARYPDGADYVIVPAVVHSDDIPLRSWVAAQGAKGATVVSICDGAIVVANAGLLKGKRATAHWATRDYRTEHFPDTNWQINARYVADDRVISSAGISAAMPTSLALVEAIAGHDKAAALAQQLGLDDWGPRHDSEIFHPRLGVNISAYLTLFTNPLFHSTQQIGVKLSDGMDDIALALTMDAWSRTGRSKAVALAESSALVRTHDGLTVMPDRDTSSPEPDRMSPPLAGVAPGKMLDRVLEGIADAYGKRTAYRVALDFEYPGYR